MAGFIAGGLVDFVKPVQEMAVTFQELSSQIGLTLGEVHEMRETLADLLGGVGPEEVVKRTDMIWEPGFQSKFSVFIVDKRLIEIVTHLQCSEKEVHFFANTLAKYSNKNSDCFDWFLWLVYRVWNGIKAVFKVSDWQITRRMLASKFEDMILVDAQKPKERRFLISLTDYEPACEVAAELFLIQALFVNIGTKQNAKEVSLKEMNHTLYLAPLQPRYEDIVREEKMKAQIARDLVVPSPSPLNAGEETEDGEIPDVERVETLPLPGETGLQKNALYKGRETTGLERMSDSVAGWFSRLGRGQRSELGSGSSEAITGKD